jgi:hypothetical protein
MVEEEARATRRARRTAFFACVELAATPANMPDSASATTSTPPVSRRWRSSAASLASAARPGEGEVLSVIGLAGVTLTTENEKTMSAG